MTRSELRSGYPNRVDGALVMVMGRRGGKLRIGVAQDGGERTQYVEEGDHLELVGTWRVVRVEPQREAAGAKPGAGSGSLVAILELVE